MHKHAIATKAGTISHQPRETSAMVEGFQHSEQVHGLRYTSFTTVIARCILAIMVELLKNWNAQTTPAKITGPV